MVQPPYYSDPRSWHELVVLCITIYISQYGLHVSFDNKKVVKNTEIDIDHTGCATRY